MLRFLCTAIVVLLTPTAYSTSCLPITVCSAFEQSVAVFRGRVTEVQAMVSPPAVPLAGKADNVGYSIFRTETVRFDVLEVFKGNPGERVSASAPEAFFKEGNEYLVFANLNPATGELAAGMCSHTHVLGTTDDPDLAWVRAYRTAPATASLLAKLVMVGRPEETMDASFSLSGTATANADSDANNSYTFENLPPGTYSITANLPAGMVADTAKTVSVGPKGCAEVDWLVRYDSHVKGRLTDSAGRPVTGVPVAALKPTNNRIGFNLAREGKTDDQGAYDISGISPGDYWIALYPRAPSRTEPYLPVFYPSSATPVQAKLLHLAASETIADLDLVLPPPLPIALVHIRLVRQNGTPVDQARIDAIDIDSNLGLTFFDTTADVMGRAGFKLYAGESYSLTAVPPGQDEPCAGPIKFTARDDMDLGTIVLDKSMADCRR